MRPFPSLLAVSSPWGWKWRWRRMSRNLTLCTEGKRRETTAGENAEWRERSRRIRSFAGNQESLLFRVKDQLHPGHIFGGLYVPDNEDGGHFPLDSLYALVYRMSWEGLLQCCCILNPKGNTRRVARRRRCFITGTLTVSVHKYSLYEE